MTAVAVENDCLAAFLDYANKRGSGAALDGLPHDHPELSPG